MQRFFDVGFQAIEIERIKVTKPLHPGPSDLHRIWIEFAPFYPTAAFLLDQPGVGEHR